MQEDSKAQRLLAKLNPPLRPITGEVLTEASWRKLSKRGGRGGFDPVDWLKELTGRQGGKGEIVRTTMSQRAYAGLREAMCLEQAFEFDLALARYGTFLVDFKDSRWAPDALIRGGAMANQGRLSPKLS